PTDPSQRTVLTPPPACRLRAAIMRGRWSVLIVVQGMFDVAATLHVPPIITSGSLALGGLQVVNPAEPPHQVKPRRSSLCPWMISDAIIVLEVPSGICAIPTWGWPALPNWVYLPYRSWSGWFWAYSLCMAAAAALIHPAG